MKAVGQEDWTGLKKEEKSWDRAGGEWKITGGILWDATRGKKRLEGLTKGRNGSRNTKKKSEELKRNKGTGTPPTFDTSSSTHKHGLATQGTGS